MKIKSRKYLFCSIHMIDIENKDKQSLFFATITNKL